MTDAIEVLDRITGTVPYLRITAGTPGDAGTAGDLGSGVPGGGDGADAPDWLACARLSADPAALADLARSTAAGRGTDRDDVAMSLLVQGYAFRVASAAVGAWLLADVVLDVAAANTAIALGRHRPNALRLSRAEVVAAADPLAGLHARLVEGHLAPLVSTAHAACRVGRALLWANVGASCASAFGAFTGPLADRAGGMRDRAEAFFAAARPELAASGRVVPVGTAWAWERQACCLWYRTADGSRCADCSLWTAAERRERYEAAIAAQATPGDGMAAT